MINDLSNDEQGVRAEEAMPIVAFGVESRGKGWE